MAKQNTSAHYTLSVKDFGPIAEATVELRPFTVLVGASNTGKSYLAILLYALHQFFGSETSMVSRGFPAFRLLPPRRHHQASSEQRENMSAFLQRASHGKGDVDVALPDDIAALVRPLLDDVGHLTQDLDAEVQRCFGLAETQSLIRQPAGQAARIALLREVGRNAMDSLSYDFAITRRQSRLDASIPPNLPLRTQGVPRHMLRYALTTRRFLEVLAGSVVPCAVGPLARPIHYLPADRAGVMHAHRVVVSALINSAARAGFRAESPLPALSGVLADFLDRLIAMGDTKHNEVSSTLAERLEADILGGHVTSRQSAVGYPSFHYRPANWKSDLPLMNTSSMVSELAPVVLYLRHVVESGDVLIIEEPESHLHPAMQVRFTQLLAELVHSGVRVVVTTHSEWVLEALANLVRLSELDGTERKEIRGGELALTPDQVGAWLFEQKKRPRGSVVKEIPLDINQGTFPAGFGEVTERLYNHWAGIANLVAERKT